MVLKQLKIKGNLYNSPETLKINANSSSGNIILTIRMVLK